MRAIKISLKAALTFLVTALPVAGAANAESVTATDGGTANYGACNGVAIDFAATTNAASAVWSPSLVSGRTYALNSVAIKNASGNSGTYYLGLYTNLSGGVLSGFKGVSDAANNFANDPNNWLTFSFSNINYDVNVNATIGSGSGLLYFVYQSGTAAASLSVTIPTDKFTADTYMTNSLASVIAYGGLVANRSPQYQATITPVGTSPPPAAPTALSATNGNGAVILAWNPSSGASSYNVKRSLTSGAETTVTNATVTTVVDAGLTNGTTYYYVVSALNFYGESTNSLEVSATPLAPPAAPAGLTAAVTNTTVRLAWTASAGATSYNVKHSVSSGSGYATVASATGTNATDAGLNFSTTYYYVVTALIQASESTNSAEVGVKTAALANALTVTNSTGVSVTVASNGIYSVNFTTPTWTFSGSLAQTLGNMASDTGADNVGAYSEITFSYNSDVAHFAGIRLYNNSPAVTFNDVRLAAGANDQAFPHWTNYPSTTSHLSFGNIFSPYNFTTLFDDNLWLFFNTNHDSFILSAATNYMISSELKKSDGSLSCGINSAISQLPAGFSHRVILVATNGINQIYPIWGNTLMALANKTPPANDACVELKQIGYWTDNGTTYHYGLPNPPSGIGAILQGVKSEYVSKGIQLGYLQLDSWWYEKGPCECWYDNFGADGTYLWIPDPAAFPSGLAGFQQQLGLPLFCHNRWIYIGTSNQTPYITVSNFTMSGQVCIDPRFWTNIMSYLKSSGGCTYEQDWLGDNATANMNLTDGPAYMNNMANAAAAFNINIQYCMDQGRNYMQASLYTNVMTTRDCPDVFNTSNWKNFLFGAPMTHALGVWAWTDIYQSTETRDLLISTLSAGPVGGGDPEGAANAANLLKSVRPDGVIVKPDVPIAPVDDAYVNEALGQSRPLVATTYSDFTNSRACYIFTFGESTSQLSASFTPASLGMASKAYVYNYFAATGMVVNAGSPFNFTTTMPQDTNGGSYFIAVPVGPSGIALLGDTNKFVTLGKKRIPSISDNGTLLVTVAFAAGETNVTLTGFASNNPAVLALSGSVSRQSFNAGANLFVLNVAPNNSGIATLQFNLAAIVSGGQASIPSPTNGATGVGLAATLSWTAGTNAVTHAIYLGTSSNAVAQATMTSPEFAGQVPTNSFNPTLAAATAYYWRVDEISATTTNTGTVWTFSTAPMVGVAGNPAPANGAANLALNATLSWVPGSNAVTHALFLGTISNVVAQAAIGSQSFLGTLSTASYSPALAAGLTYYWRVDEVGGINTNVGPVWSFTTVAASASFVLTNSDTDGTTTSFNGVGYWATNGTDLAASVPPNAACDYNTWTNEIRTPESSSGGTFGGASLTLSAAPTGIASLKFKSSNNATFAFNNLIIAGGTIANGGDAANNSADTLQNIAGTINLAGNGCVSVDGSATRARSFAISANLTGSGTLTNAGGGLGTIGYGGDNIAFSGQLMVNDYVYDSLTANYGPTTVTAGSQQNLGGPGATLVLDDGQFQPTASFAMNNPGGNLTLNPGGGILQISPGLTLTISNPIVGVGNLMCGGGGTLQIAGTNTATGNLVVSNGTLAVLGGAMFCNAQMAISNNAALDVTALGVALSLSNSIVLSGNLLAVINKTNFTSLLIASNITCGGTLTLTNLGPALAYGDTIKLFGASNYSGAFSAIVPAVPGPGLLWYTNWISVNGTIFVTSTNPAMMAPPRVTSLVWAGGNIVVMGTNGNSPGTPFYALASTNLTLSLTNWIPVATNQFGPGGGFGWTNPIVSSNLWQFFIFRLP